MNDSQNEIIEVCARRLQRNLTKREEAFIASHVGFMAFEAIEDAARTLNVDALEELLNSKENE